MLCARRTRATIRAASVGRIHAADFHERDVDRGTALPLNVGSQGVEPRVSARDGWFTASCSHQCCSLPDVMVRTMGLEPMASTLATSRSTWLNYIRGIRKASETLTLARASKISPAPGLSPSTSQTHHRVLNANACCATGESNARCDARVRALQHSWLSNSVLSERAAQGPKAKRVRVRIEGFTSRTEHWFGWFSPPAEGSQVAWLPWVPRPASAFGAKSLKAVTDRVRSRSRDNVSRRAVTSYP
jgi:hypothetical protein